MNDQQANISEIETDLEEFLKKIIVGLNEGRKIADWRFDQIYPPTIRKLSNIHWTPVDVSIRAAELLVTDEHSRILDVGSGCGKFCIVAALTRPGRVTGVEQRESLVETARTAADLIQASRASFIHGNMADLDWNEFDGFYFFNPFYENIVSSIQIDQIVPSGLSRLVECVRIVKLKLRRARIGTRVVTYHGFGGEFPRGYALLGKERIGSDHLELWEKQWHTHDN